jgi:hypothetical protein
MSERFLIQTRKEVHMAASEIDQLEKLSRLKEKGVLSAEEFEKKKTQILSGAKSSRKGWIWRFPLFIFGALLLISGVGTLTGGFPACDSSEAEEALQNAFEQNATSNVATLKYLGLKDVNEVSFDAEKNERKCRATALLNSGSETIAYRLFANGDDLLVEVNLD